MGRYSNQEIFAKDFPDRCGLERLRSQVHAIGAGANPNVSGIGYRRRILLRAFHLWASFVQRAHSSSKIDQLPQTHPQIQYPDSRDGAAYPSGPDKALNAKPDLARRHQKKIIVAPIAEAKP